MQMRVSCTFLTAIAATFLTFSASAVEPPLTPPGEVSYYKQIRPILQAHCQGCHQPAKAKGGYVMTEFKGLLAGGDDEGLAVVPGKPAKSPLLALITPDKDGEAEMPKDKNPLHSAEIELIKNWIAEGAKDDTPASAQKLVDADHPPLYTLPPVITSLDYSPDGKWLAVAGIPFKAASADSLRIETVDGDLTLIDGGLCLAQSILPAFPCANTDTTEFLNGLKPGIHAEISNASFDKALLQGGEVLLR